MSSNSVSVVFFAHMQITGGARGLVIRKLHSAQGIIVQFLTGTNHV
jgi:hypothetical protein